MDGIRINTGAKRIPVNEGGDYITLNLNDASFPKRFYAMVDNATAKADNASEKAKEFAEKYGEKSDEFNRASANLWDTVHREIMAEIDTLFGEGTCKKVFGGIVPDLFLIEDFFLGMSPYLEEAGKERARRMSKYSAARTGNA